MTGVQSLRAVTVSLLHWFSGASYQMAFCLKLQLDLFIERIGCTGYFRSKYKYSSCPLLLRFVYQHQCCTVSLIASFCSINPQYLPFLSIFLHAFLVICQFEFVCIPNGMTAEPKSHGRPTKPQRESEYEIVFRLSPGAHKISGTRQIWKLASTKA